MGVDIAETYIHVDIYDLALDVIGQAESDLPIDENDPSSVARRVAGVVDQAAAAAGIPREGILRVGVSLPGQVDPQRGVSVFAPNWDWHGVRIQSLLSEAIGLPVDVDNPLRAIAIAELWFGAGRVVDNVATVNLGTGVGAGLAIGGDLVRGTSNTAGEWGHTTLIFGGRLCRCGRQGCVEAYLGVPGLQMTMAEVNASHDLLTGDRQREFVSDVAKGLAEGDPDCIELLEVTGRYFAAALGNLINFINPDHVSVLGWTAKVLGPELLRVTQKHLPNEMLPSAGSAVRVELSTVPGNSVTLGMATFALEGFFGAGGVAKPRAHQQIDGIPQTIAGGCWRMNRPFLKLPERDYELSPYTGLTREHWAGYADCLLCSVHQHASESHANIYLPGPASAFGRSSDSLEAFARTFLLASFRIAGDPEGTAWLADWYAAGFDAGTDPASPERWPRPDELGQAKVEAASLAVGLALTREHLWDKLPQRVQEQVIAWFETVIGGDYPPINWVWFQIVVETFLSTVGGRSI
ncbi:ROK family protein [Arthrobacter sp. SA17]